MTASAAKSSSTTRTDLPKSPTVARRHYLTQVCRHRIALAEARAAGADTDVIEGISEDLAEAKQMARRARAWGQRSAHRSSLVAPCQNTVSRRRNRIARPLPITARDAEVDVGEASIADPYAPGSFRTGQINRRVDVLATEHGAGRISEAQFLVGRMIQAVFERKSGAKLGSGGWDISGSRDQTIAHELAIIYAIEDAEKVKKFVGHLERAIGAVGVRFLRAILSEGQTFATYAAARGKAGDRGTAQIAGHFRLLLEGLVESQHTAQGAGRPVPDDQYAARAREVAGA